MTNHTPGPWRIDESVNYDGGHGRCSSAIVGKNGEPVVLFDPSDGEYAAALDSNSADARLIAAAPDLLAALQACDEAMKYMSKYDIPIMLPAQVKAAIAKATGEE